MKNIDIKDIAGKIVFWGIIIFAGLVPLLGWKLKYLWMTIALAWFIRGASFKNILFIPAVVYLIVTIVSIIAGVDPASSFRYSIKNDVNILIFFIMASSVKDKEQAMDLVKIFLIGVAVACFLGLLQYVFRNTHCMIKFLNVLNIEPLGLTNGRVCANRIHPCIFANNLGLYVPLMIAFYLLKRSVVSFAGVIFFCAILLLTYTRMPILSVGFVFLFTGILFFRKIKYFVLPILLSIILALGLMLPNKGRVLKERMNLRDGGRFSFWKKAETIIKEYPLFGVGPGNVMPVYSKISGRRKVELYHVHNNFLQITAERGVFALIVYIWALIIFFTSLYKRFVSNRVAMEQKYILGGIIAGSVVFTFGGLTDYTFCRPEMYFPFYFLAGIAMSPAFRESLE